MPKLTPAQQTEKNRLNALLTIVPAELPAPLVIELLATLGGDALIMFALHNSRMRDTVIGLIDGKLREHEIIGVTGKSLIGLLEVSVETAIRQATP